MLIWPRVYSLYKGLTLLKCASSLQMTFEEAKYNIIHLTEQFKLSCVATKENTQISTFV